MVGAGRGHRGETTVNVDLLMLIVLVVLVAASAAYVAALNKL